MRSFSEAMRAEIKAGHTPSQAMRSVWARVKQGQVAPPPRKAAGRVALAVRRAQKLSFCNPQFKSYDEARREALKKARALKRDVGIYAVKDYEGRGFNVGLLPAEGKRFGHELRAEVVKPTDPNPVVSRRKARAILRHGEVGGLPLTPPQRGLFGAIASGQRLRQYRNPTRLESESYRGEIKTLDDLHREGLPLVARDLKSRGFAGTMIFESKHGPAAFQAYYTPRGRLAYIAGSRALYKRIEREIAARLRGGTEGNPQKSVMMYEGATPVVRHTFYGKTAGDVRAVEHAHIKADRSLAAAVRGRRYRGVKITTHPVRSNPNGLGPCVYCGSPGGFMSGPEHSMTCPRYVKPKRRIKTISALCPTCHRALHLIAKGKRQHLPQCRPQGNPLPAATPIYGRVLGILAKKTAGQHAGKIFEHQFRAGAKAFGLPNGDVLLTTRRL